MTAAHLIYIIFLFALGACVGSFLNVVVYRLPHGKSWWDGIKRLTYPPSHCPNCNTPLAWSDNIPVLGWIMLRGQCRYCHVPISKRYPLVEAATGLIFVLYYVSFFLLDLGPCLAAPPSQWGVIAQPVHMEISRDWPIYGLYMFALAGLLASSLIDAELFIIPLEIPWTLAVVGIIVHALAADPGMPGNLVATPMIAAAGAGGLVGLLISVGLLMAGVLPRSFAQGEPILEVDRRAMTKEIEALKKQGQPAPPLPPEYTSGQIRLQMLWEILFILLPVLGAALMMWMVRQTGVLHESWTQLMQKSWLAGLLGSINGALVGAAVVWLTRIFGTLAFGRVAMGLGDVHLMFGVGAVLGGLGVTVAFFIAPFFGLVLALWMLIRQKRRELPFGPYLSLGAAAVMLFYCPISNYLHNGLEGILFVFGAGGN